jgi:hypothetical protein
VDAGEAQDVSERDQLWASLRALRPEIDRLAAGTGEPTDRDRVLAALLARIVAAELDFRAREAETDGPAQHIS